MVSFMVIVESLELYLDLKFATEIHAEPLNLFPALLNLFIHSFVFLWHEYSKRD